VIILFLKELRDSRILFLFSYFINGEINRSSKSLSDPTDLPELVEYALAGCHSLVYVEGKLVGDPMETASLKAINWTFTKGNKNSDHVS
jgi:magnesium-transporting ATPase (P-type)